MNQAGTNHGRRKSFLLIALILALIGVGVTVYATQHHLQVKATGSSDAVCNITATVNCNDVARSQYSEVFGIPVAVWGLGYFIAIAALLSGTWFGVMTLSALLPAYATLVGIGVLTSIVLGTISITKIGVVCPTCVATYVVTALQAVVLFIFRDQIKYAGLNKLVNGGAVAVVALVLTIGGFHLTAGKAPTSASQPTTATPPAPTGPAVDLVINRSAYSGLGEDYRKGSDQAKVVITEFADFQCPACQYTANNLREVAKIYGDAVQIVFKNYPLDRACNSGAGIHPHACAAATIARCAGQFGKFWQMHDLIFDRQDQINTENLKKWAGEIGISPQQVESCLNSKDILAKIQDDIVVGDRVHVEGTPTLYFNGRIYNGGKDVESLKAAIESML